MDCKMRNGDELWEWQSIGEKEEKFTEGEEGADMQIGRHEWQMLGLRGRTSKIRS